jgi:hypothetical protein
MNPILARFLKIKKSDVNYILREYIRLRKMFIDSGIKDRQLEKGEGMTHNMYMQREYVIYSLKKLKSDARRFGVIEGDNFEIDDYFSDLFLRVDKKTPL